MFQEKLFQQKIVQKICFTHLFTNYHSVKYRVKEKHLLSYPITTNKLKEVLYR